MANHEAQCPVCGEVITAERRDQLIMAVQDHAKEQHDKVMSTRDVREAIGQQQE